MWRRLSLSAWAAVVLFVVLVLLVAAAWLILSLNPNHVPWRTAGDVRPIASAL